MPVKKGGWRFSNLSTAVVTCFNAAACTGAEINATASQRRRLAATSDGSTAGDALCAPGHTGFLCGQCQENWYGYKENTLCTACTGSLALAFVPLIVFGIAVILVLVAYRKGKVKSLGGLNAEAVLKGGVTKALKDTAKKQVQRQITQGIEREKTRRMVRTEEEEKRSLKDRLVGCVLINIGRAQKMSVKFKILLTLWQILQGIGMVFAIPFPPFYEQTVTSVAGVLQIELPALMPLDCIVRASYYERLIFKTVWPLAVYILLFVSAKGLRVRGKEDQADSLINFLFLIMFLLYPSISSQLLSMFYCYGREDGTSWLRVDLSLDCNTSQHYAMLAYTWIMIGVHTLGTPGIYCYLYFFKHYSALEALKEQELDDYYDKKIADEKKFVTQKTVVNLEGVKMKRRIEPKDVLPGYMIKLTSGYEYRTYWFEIFETIRKVLLVGVPSVFPERGGTAQLFWGLIVCFITFGMYMVRCRPHPFTFAHIYPHHLHDLITTPSPLP